jgi:hypothetical protein
MWFRAGDFSLEDTVAFELPNIQGGDIQLAMVRLAIDNGLPVDVKMQVYFADSTFHVLDVMFSDTLPQIPSGVISNTTFKVTSSTSKINDVSFDNVKINKIKKTKWALVKASLTTTDYATKPGLKVKFYDSYKLGFKLYVKAQMKITIKNP